MANEASLSWYFAYGSNLWREQMMRRVGPSCLHAPPQVVRLPNYRLAFNMRGSEGGIYANIETPGEGVLGVIYRCSPDAYIPLDDFEAGYDRVEVQVLDSQGTPITAFVYIAKPESIALQGRPSEAYVKRILTGAKEYGLPEDYIRGIEQIAANR